MSSKSVSPISVSDLENSFGKLSEAASALNSVSDEFAKPVEAINTALKKLGLGVSAWTKFDKWESDFGEFSYNAVGYARVGGKWGLAISHVEGNYSDPERESSEEWSFNEAPRHLRVRAVEHIPGLIEELVTATQAFTKKITERLTDVTQIAAVINPAMAKAAPRLPPRPPSLSAELTVQPGKAVKR